MGLCKAASCGGQTFRGLPPSAQTTGAGTREQLGIVAVADVDQDVGLDLTLRKELLLDLRGVEPGHRACVEADRAQREDQVGDLQRAVVKR